MLHFTAYPSHILDPFQVVRAHMHLEANDSLIKNDSSSPRDRCTGILFIAMKSNVI